MKTLLRMLPLLFFLALTPALVSAQAFDEVWEQRNSIAGSGVMLVVTPNNTYAPAELQTPMGVRYTMLHGLKLDIFPLLKKDANEPTRIYADEYGVLTQTTDPQTVELVRNQIMELYPNATITETSVTAFNRRYLDGMKAMAR